MTTEDQIIDEKVKFDINREAAKISALSSGNIDKYEYLTGKEILPPNQQQITDQAKFTYSPLGKAFEKQTKTIEDQGKKQVDALESLKASDKEQLTLMKDFIPKEKLNPEIINEIKRIEEEDKKVDRDNMVYESSNKTYGFRKFKTIRAFGNEIRNNINNLDEESYEHNQHLNYIKELNRNTKPWNPEFKKIKRKCI